jgi:hypothetical protein
MRHTTIATLLLSGCALDWSGPPDDDVADQDAEQLEQFEADPDDAGGDQVDDPGSDQADEDDGWTDPAGEDGGEESAADICLDSCNDGFHPERIGRCDDGGTGSSSSDCDYGTDCTDCGPRPAEEP